MAGVVKREPGVNTRSRRRNDTQENAEVDPADNVSTTHRRVLRSRYLNVKNRIFDVRDDLSTPDSDKFQLLFSEVETLHNQVQKPREQVTDAEALLDITDTLVTSVKSQSNAGVSPADFITCLLRDFGRQGGASTSNNEGGNSVRWMNIGAAVSHVFMSVSGCCTMLGPMDQEIKQRKALVRRKRERPAENSQPKELNDSDTDERTDTDHNMATMFNILKKYRSVRLESLILNRNCFAQTVENLFALSFLIKDGRAEIKVDKNGCHFVSPRNAPAANAVTCGEVSYSHFLFRFDFRDWQLMVSDVKIGEELMPHRNQIDVSSLQDEVPDEPRETIPTTPIRKLTRNRGRVLHEQTVVEDSPDVGESAEVAAAIRKGKRKLG